MNACVFDEFSRWLCSKCGEPGIDSWNKAIFDGVDHEDVENPELPHVLGMDCTSCGWAVTVRYDTPDLPPVAIYSPVPADATDENQYAYEGDAMAQIRADRAAGLALADAGPLERDHNWRGGCRNLRQAPLLGGEA